MSSDINTAIIDVISKFAIKWDWVSGATLYWADLGHVVQSFHRDDQELQVGIKTPILELKLKRSSPEPSAVTYNNSTKQQQFFFYAIVDECSIYLDDPKMLSKFRRFAKLRR